MGNHWIWIYLVLATKYCSLKHSLLTMQPTREIQVWGICSLHFHGARTTKKGWQLQRWGCQPSIWAIFSQKLYENEKNWTGRRHTSLALLRVHQCKESSKTNYNLTMDLSGGSRISRGGTPKSGMKIYYSTQKLHENERNWTERWICMDPLIGLHGNFLVLLEYISFGNGSWHDLLN